MIYVISAVVYGALGCLAFVAGGLIAWGAFLVGVATGVGHFMLMDRRQR